MQTFWTFTFIIFLFNIKGSLHLTYVRVYFPSIANFGMSVDLHCLHNGDVDNIFEVDWYTDQHKFVEIDMTKRGDRITVLPATNVHVNVLESDEHRLKLDKVVTNTTYGCSVTTKDNITKTDFKPMSVLKLSIRLALKKKSFFCGDTVTAFCTLIPFIDDIQMRFFYNNYDVPKESSKLFSQDTIQLQHKSGKQCSHMKLPAKLEIKCSVYSDSLFEILSKSVDITVDKSVAVKANLNFILFTFCILITAMFVIEGNFC